MPIGLIHVAQLDHIHWRKTLIYQVTSLSFGDNQDAGICGISAELDHHLCKLGKWYYGVGQEFKGTAAFDELEEPHRVLHELGAQLIAAAQNGGTREEITAGLRALTKQSGLVLESLQELENEAVLKQA